MRLLKSTLVGISLLVGCVGCGERDVRVALVEIESSADATRIMVELARERVDSAQCNSATVQRKSVQKISVLPRDLGRAREILVWLDLPRKTGGGLESLRNGGGLVASPTDERARLMLAYAEELQRTLECMDGVLTARVHLWLPEKSQLDDTAPAAVHASVFIRHRSDAMALDPDAIRRVVAGALPTADNATSINITLSAAAPLPPLPSPSSVPIERHTVAGEPWYQQERRMTGILYAAVVVASIAFLITLWKWRSAATNSKVTPRIAVSV